MRIPNLYQGKYTKSYNKTQKILRTVTHQKPYIQKSRKEEAEKEQELLEYIKKQKELENDIQDKLNEAVENIKASEIQYNALLLYGIKLNKEQILEKLKARKAKK